MVESIHYAESSCTCSYGKPVCFNIKEPQTKLAIF